MKHKIDLIRGRLVYNRRLGTAEPIFGNICFTLGLNRFSLRGKRKVNTQKSKGTLVQREIKRDIKRDLKLDIGFEKQ